MLVVLDVSMGWSRGILRGFVEAARRHPWRVLHYQWGSLEWLIQVWKPAAVVLQGSLYPSIRELKGPIVVSVNDDGHDSRRVASVCLDEEAIGTLAATHLLGKGLTQLTTFRFNSERFALARERAFKKVARAQGVHLAPPWWKDGASPPSSAEDPVALTSWVKGLPRQTGVFSCTDSWATVVARYAELAGVRVPEDLAIVGADNDTFECELALPPLSSVAIPWRKVGEYAAELVELALSGREITGERIIVPPTDVIARRSSEVTAVEDQTVIFALGWIAKNASRKLSLDSVARASGCSRQRLEVRFRAATGRTVMQEVRRARVEMARSLLVSSTAPLAEIAKRSGFADAASLSVGFRREKGVSPGEYRRRLEGRGFED